MSVGIKYFQTGKKMYIICGDEETGYYSELRKVTTILVIA